jgi:hypothetical protein
MVTIQGIQLLFLRIVGDAGFLGKACISEPPHYLADYVSRLHYWDMEGRLNKIVDSLQIAIDGNYSQLTQEEWDISNDFTIVWITITGVEFHSANSNAYDTYPLIEFRDTLLAWKTFLLTPPLDGTKMK